MHDARAQLPCGPVGVSFDRPRVSDEDLALHAGALARTLAGTALLIGAVVSLCGLWLDGVDVETVLPATWLVAAGAWVGVRIGGPLLLRPLVTARASVDDQGFGRSWALWLIGIALLLPLTSHLFVVALFSGQARGFEGWATASAVLVGHVHVVLAFMIARRALAIARGKRPPSRGMAYVLPVLASFVPGMFMMFLPVLLVALTGLLFLPVMAAADALMWRERRQRLARRRP